MIYCVEDDDAIRGLMLYALHAAGFETEGFADGEGLFAALETRLPRLILLDIMLPGEDGISILKKLRGQAATAAVPVIMATARGTEYDKVTGLDLGADDYLTKPFDLEELEARVRTLLRREYIQRTPLVQAGGLTLDTRAREVSVQGRAVSLTPREFSILEYLMLHQGRWISQEELWEHIWEADADPFSNVIRMHISSLRRKLRERLGHDPIETKIGRGYRLNEEAAL